jgi:hypothetical protein
MVTIRANGMVNIVMNRKIAALSAIILSLIAVIALLSLLNNGTAQETAKDDTLSQEQKLWCLAARAVLTQKNQDRHDILGDVERTDKNINIWMENLSDGWGIEDRKTLFESLRWIKAGGHRRSFAEIASFLSTANEYQLKEFQSQANRDPELANQIEIVRKHYASLGAKNLMGWDYSRYISLCGWGYFVGYITEEEAWGLILPVAQLLQDTFDSWEDLGRNYLIGREFWSLQRTQANGDRYVAAYEWLCSDPESPYLTIPWDLDLSAAHSDVGVPANQSP